MSAITSQYAHTLADVLFEKHLDRDQTRQALELIAALLESSRELRTIWQNPAVPSVQKRKVLDWIVARAGASQMVRNFIAVLIDRHRVPQLFLTEHRIQVGILPLALSTGAEEGSHENIGH